MKPTLEAINQFWTGVANHKKETRKRQAALSFSEKIKILEKLRDRDRVIAACGLRGKAGRAANNQARKRSRARRASATHKGSLEAT
jgi:hypothetical protein